MYWFDPKFTYEENCEEFISYMSCECEAFNFGEGLMEMESYEGSMYEFRVLSYLNDLYYPDLEAKNYFRLLIQTQLNTKIELKFNEMSRERIQIKLNNKYHKNMNVRSRRLFNCKYSKSHFRYPYHIKMDQDGNEYLSYKNDNRKYKGWNKNRRKTIRTKEIEFYNEK